MGYLKSSTTLYLYHIVKELLDQLYKSSDWLSVTWMKWMWSSVRDSWVISLSRLFRSAISWLSRSMWPSALLSAALLLEAISLVISCCILSMERIMSPNIFSHSCSALWAEFCTGKTDITPLINWASHWFYQHTERLSSLST